MKKIFVFLLMLMPLMAQADMVEIDGVSYFIVGGEANVQKKTGGYTGDVVVPATITYQGKTYPVTTILSYAFSGNDNLKSVVLAEGITTIKDYVFFAAHGLETVQMPSTITSWGESVFGGCTSLKTFFLPDFLTKVPDGTFDGCESLTTIELSDKITEIGEKAFASCEKVSTIKIPASVTSIGDMAFWNCNPKDIYCYATAVPETVSGAFDLLDIEAVTVHVPAASVAAYKKAEGWTDFVKVVGIK